MQPRQFTPFMNRFLYPQPITSTYCSLPQMLFRKNLLWCQFQLQNRQIRKNFNILKLNQSIGNESFRADIKIENDQGKKKQITQPGEGSQSYKRIHNKLTQQFQSSKLVLNYYDPNFAPLLTTFKLKGYKPFKPASVVPNDQINFENLDEKIHQLEQLGEIEDMIPEQPCSQSAEPFIIIKNSKYRKKRKYMRRNTLTLERSKIFNQLPHEYAQRQKRIVKLKKIKKDLLKGKPVQLKKVLSSNSLSKKENIKFKIVPSPKKQISQNQIQIPFQGIINHEKCLWLTNRSKFKQQFNKKYQDLLDRRY